MLDAILAISDVVKAALIVFAIVMVWAFWADVSALRRHSAEVRKGAEERERGIELDKLTHCQACGNALAQVGARKCAACGEWQR